MTQSRENYIGCARARATFSGRRPVISARNNKQVPIAMGRFLHRMFHAGAHCASILQSARKKISKIKVYFFSTGVVQLNFHQLNLLI
jgi:hypothetical protein